MDTAAVRDLLKRLDVLERTAVRARVGEVTDDSPLTITLGGADTEIASPATLAGARRVTTGDIIAALTYGNGALVLGPLADNQTDPGAPLCDQASAGATRAQSTSYGVGSPDDVNLTLPIAGDWDFYYGAQLNSPQNGQTAYMALDFDGTVDTASELLAYVYGTGVTEFAFSVAGAYRKTSLAAGTVVKPKYKCNATAGMTASCRHLRATLVRAT